jgi:hypothetical protein
MFPVGQGTPCRVARRLVPIEEFRALTTLPDFSAESKNLVPDENLRSDERAANGRLKDTY